MLKFTDTLSYVVYPSWADFDHKWEDLPEKIAYPEKYADKQWYHENNKIYFNHNPSHQEFIAGSDGGGIIIHDLISVQVQCPEDAYGKQWLGRTIFNIEEYEFNPVFGSPATIEHSCNVSYITRRKVPLLQKLGIHRPLKPQYHIWGSFDHVESVGSKIYLAAVNDKNKKISNKVLELLPQMVQQFGLFLMPIVTTPNEIATEKAHWFLDNNYTFYWFELKTDCIDVQRIFAFLVYGGLHLKKLRGAFGGIQLVGQIEHQPKGKLPYHLTQEDKEMYDLKKDEQRKRLQEMREQTIKSLSELSPKDRKKVERYLNKWFKKGYFETSK
jgi:hypothetical protein